MLEERISQHRSAILGRWHECILESYPAETARFLRAQSDQFANPVGAALNEGLGAILDGLLAHQDASEMAPALDRIIRIRAVQEHSPSTALAFIFDLKKVIAEELAQAAGKTGATGDTAARDAVAREEQQTFGQWIDQLMLTAFDVYTRCREQISTIRIAEIKNRSLNRLERLNAWQAQRDRDRDRGDNSQGAEQDRDADSADAGSIEATEANDSASDQGLTKVT